MNLNQYTERSQGFIQSAQTLAQREGHQRILPLHLLKVLLDDEEGLCASLIRSAGGDAKNALERTNDEMGRLPKVGGSGAGQVFLSPELTKVFELAEKEAKKAGDTFVTVEYLLLALALSKETDAHKILDSSGLAPEKLKLAIETMRKGRRADTATAESQYDALKKYATDMTALARQGKLDPVIGRDEEIRRT
ncbi:MAG TPA: ATP-dependent chaperone ClpB, partial [Holosporales bacterium]|nr:ATP-dependent chaperone ClpB [Holosporales bacterium]